MSRPVRPLRVASLASTRDDRGFTLIELIIVTAITPMIIGAIAVGLVQIFSLQGSIANRLQNSNDTQVISSTLAKDVENSVLVTTDPTSTSPAPCGTGATETQLLGLQWNSGADVVTYATVPNGTSGPYPTVNLVRNMCVTGSPPTSNILAFNLLPTQLAPSVTCLSSYSSCVSSSPTSSGSASSGWLASMQVQEVTLHVSERTANPSVPYSAALTAYPVQNLSTNPALLGGPTTVSTCGFAVAGTGTYAAGASQQLCFLDFTFLNNATSFAAATSPTGIDVQEGAPNGYTIRFHLHITMESLEQRVVGAKFWTWTNAFMGNNVSPAHPFYSGVGCVGAKATDPSTGLATKSCIAPAIYEQYNPASSTYASHGGKVIVTISNISLLSPANTPVGGYEMVSMDAETTDAGEYLTWKVTSPGAPYQFHLIPNSASSPIGNACNSLVLGKDSVAPTTNSSTNDLINMNLDTGLSTGPTVTCQVGSSTSTVRTGTPMLGFLPQPGDPPTLTVTMYGTGLEGVGFALLVPS